VADIAKLAIGTQPAAINDAPLLATYAELRGLLAADHVPEGVKLAALRLGECQKKLFCFVGTPNPALGAVDLSPGLHPSDLLCELIQALRALDWPRFIVLVHDALSGSQCQSFPTPVMNVSPKA